MWECVEDVGAPSKLLLLQSFEKGAFEGLLLFLFRAGCFLERKTTTFQGDLVCLFEKTDFGTVSTCYGERSWHNLRSMNIWINPEPHIFIPNMQSNSYFWYYGFLFSILLYGSFDFSNTPVPNQTDQPFLSSFLQSLVESTNLPICFCSLPFFQAA